MPAKIIRPYRKTLESKWGQRTLVDVASLMNQLASELNPIRICHIEAENNDKFLHFSRIEHGRHPLIQATNEAFYEHLPLVLTPDVIWYCISNAAAIYINENAVEMRNTIVDNKDKKEIVVVRMDFFLGKKNPWHELIDEFSEKIKENTKTSLVDIMQADFSTTTKISRVASQIVILDATKAYFKLVCYGGCGIPEIRLQGEKSDWQRIKSKATSLIAIIPAFKDWIASVNEIMDHFIDAFDDKIDNLFWKSIFLYGGGSGGPQLTGWLISLFPYLHKISYDPKVPAKYEKNPYCWDGNSWKDAMGEGGMGLDNFKYKANKVPFLFKYGDENPADQHDMFFLGGLVGVSVDSVDHALTPTFGYAVTQQT